MGNFIDQVDRVAASRLNTGTGDPTPGQSLGSTTGLPVIGFDGQVAKRILLNGVAYGSQAEATRNSDPTVGQLYGGIYQYVQFLATSVAANARGQLVFWSDVTNAIVTPDASATNTGLVCGVTLMPVAKGNFAWIQIAGLASVLFKATITKATPAIGDLVMVDATPSNRADTIADATSLTSPLQKTVIGIAYDLAVNNSISRVLLSGMHTGF